MALRPLRGPRLTLHRDHLASVRLVTNASGTTTEATNYAAYGERTNSGFQTQKSYIGERFDPESGLLYLNARYMDPVLGRFISPDDWDPTMPGVGTNRYAYAQNDPVNKADNNGHIVNIVGPALVGAFTGATLEGLSQVYQDGYISDSGAMAKAALVGGVAGGVSGFMGPAVGDLAGSYISSKIGVGIMKGSIGSFFGATCGSFTEDALNQKRPSMPKALASAAISAHLGGLLGAIFNHVECYQAVQGAVPQVTKVVNMITIGLLSAAIKTEIKRDNLLEESDNKTPDTEITVNHPTSIGDNTSKDSIRDSIISSIYPVQQ